MKKVYSYIRFSTPEQAKGDSLRRQIDNARQWCSERGLVMDESLRDLGISAYTGTNRTTGALRSFLDLVESGKIPKGSILLVESLDRLSREAVIDAASRLFDLIRSGITIVTLVDGQEYSAERLNNDWSPLIVSIAVMARAHEESRTKGKRVGEAWAKKKQAAREEGRPLTRRCPAWIQIANKKYEVIPEKAQIVQRIFRMAIEGHGSRTILKALNSDGIPTFMVSKKKQNNGWQTSSLRRLLTSRTVLGEYQPHVGRHWARKPEGDPVKGFYPAIIDEATFWRAQSAMESRRGRGGRKGEGVAHLLQGLAKCGDCGSAMHIINKGPLPKGGTYFECSAARRKFECSNTERWRVDRIEARLLKALTYIDVDAVVFGEQRDEVSDKVDILQAKLADAEQRRKRLIVLVESGDDAAAERFQTVAAEVKHIKGELTKATKEAAKTAADPGVKAALINAIDLSQLMTVVADRTRYEYRVRLAHQMRKLVQIVEFHSQEGATARLIPQLNLPPGRVPWAAYGFETRSWLIWLNSDDVHGLDFFAPDPEMIAQDTPAPNFELRGRRG
ncbi:recombinase family protein [Nitrobacter hamburgensis]|uniref:recombinase family protein n=1 Tax=Nitrobacter hamburgensis TaxID=912 RepID=UPI000055725D|nr:recombinase family protein [Nitrobacter hamburgensis]